MLALLNRRWAFTDRDIVQGFYVHTYQCIWNSTPV